MKRRHLRTRIALSVLIYSLILGTAILSLGYLINERVERLIWEAMLSAEVEHMLTHPERISANALIESGTLHAYRGSPQDGFQWVPEALRSLPPGLHDEVTVGDHEYAVLVQNNGNDTLFMTIDITELEASEASMTGMLLLAAAVLTLSLAFASWWLAGRLTRPITELVVEIDRLRPDDTGNRVQLRGDTDAELQRIIDALNGLLARTDGFLARERAFLSMASHELRTPVAVIAGATTLAQGYREMPDGLRRALQRIARASRDMEQLIRMLLVLAKSPERVLDSATDIDLIEVIQDVVEDHAHLSTGKGLTVQTGTLQSTSLRAPVQLVQVAVANLLRNAIEQSDSGTISVSVAPPGVVHIVDPGHGLSPEEISRLYAERARNTSNSFHDGIGLQLIARICEHLGWTITLKSELGRGTSVSLDLRGGKPEVSPAASGSLS
jgi:signal transduction histidine kinase